VDICGPSIPHMLGLDGEEIHQSNMGWQPVYVQVGTGHVVGGTFDLYCWYNCWSVAGQPRRYVHCLHAAEP
jgi:hypothetical protein